MPTTYHAYLLRLWRVYDNGENWRIQLESVANGERHAFTSLEGLLDYLHSLEDKPAPGERSADMEEDV